MKIVPFLTFGISTKSRIAARRQADYQLGSGLYWPKVKLSASAPESDVGGVGGVGAEVVCQD